MQLWRGSSCSVLQSCTRSSYLINSLQVSYRRSVRLSDIFVHVAHRALPDVEAVEALFMSTPLQDILPSLLMRTPQQQLHQWRLQMKLRNASQSLLRFFGKTITKAHARQLSANDITQQDLREWKEEVSSREDFIKLLKGKKVNSKFLRERLCSFFFR